MSEGVQLGQAWTLEQLESLSTGNAVLEFGRSARERVRAARGLVEQFCDAGDGGESVYGVNTGFGALAETRVPSAQLVELQHNLVRSHACGVGDPLPEHAVRAMLALRAQTLAMGHSGVREIVIETLSAMLAKGVVPIVPSKGSVGASGDLAPLAHLALVLIGEGEARFEGQVVSGAVALEKAGIPPVVLSAKEGLALINGTQMMMAVGAPAAIAAERLCKIADIVGAMSLDALQGSDGPFDPRIQAIRPHPGQAHSAANLRQVLAGSEIRESHVDCGKVQDPYSLRCMPQIHGTTRDALAWVRLVLERELVAVTDNPLIFMEGPNAPTVISGGNFHGQPIAMALDLASMAVAELASVAERRLEQLVNPAMSSGLPPFLAPRSGLDSGFMMAQVTAAALVSENKVLSHPSVVDSIPSSAGKEDHVSMGSISSRKFATIVEHVEIVLAIEAMVAAQGLELRKPLRGGVGVNAAYEAIRTRIPKLEADRNLSHDIQSAVEILASGELIHSVEAAVGSLL